MNIAINTDDKTITLRGKIDFKELLNILNTFDYSGYTIGCESPFTWTTGTTWTTPLMPSPYVYHIPGSTTTGINLYNHVEDNQV